MKLFQISLIFKHRTIILNKIKMKIKKIYNNKIIHIPKIYNQIKYNNINNRNKSNVFLI